MSSFIAASHFGLSRRGARLCRRATTMTAPIEAPALITFDFTGTLFEPRSTVGKIYRQVLCTEAARESAACGEAADSLSVAALDAAFRSAYAAAAEAHPCFGAGSLSSEVWWRGVVESTIVGAAGPDVFPALASALPLAFDELFGSTFVSAQGWRPLPSAVESLQALSAWRAAQPAARRPCVGVISNWDERLPRLLDELEVASHFDFVLTSREVGVEKPAPLIFDRARELAGVSADARAVHIGDSVGNDVAGAAAVGWEAIYAKSAAKRARLGAAERAALDAVPHRYVEDLSGLLPLLGCTG
jgi:putative hydrolase of the HAD superfamily